MKKTLLILFVVISASLLLISCTKDTVSNVTPDTNIENGTNGDAGNDTENGKESEDYTPIDDFDADEKAMLTELGFSIPFLANDAYMLTDCSADKDGSSLHFSALGASQSEFDVYRTLYASYSYHGTSIDENGITHHTYYTDGFFIDMTYSVTDGTGRVDVCVRIDEDGTGNNPTQNENGDCDVEFGDGI